MQNSTLWSAFVCLCEWNAQTTQRLNRLPRSFSCLSKAVVQKCERAGVFFFVLNKHRQWKSTEDWDSETNREKDFSAIIFKDLTYIPCRWLVLRLQAPNAYSQFRWAWLWMIDTIKSERSRRSRSTIRNETCREAVPSLTGLSDCQCCGEAMQRQRKTKGVDIRCSYAPDMPSISNSTGPWVRDGCC